jgi:hypothetical protein
MSAAVPLTFYYEEVCSMRFLDSVNQPACEHLRCGIEQRLFLVYNALFTKDPVTKTLRYNELNIRAETLRRCSSANSNSLQQQYHAISRLENWASEYHAPHPQCKCPKDTQNDPFSQKGTGFCCWATYCLPKQYLETFGLSTGDFCECLHDTKQPRYHDTYCFASIFFIDMPVIQLLRLICFQTCTATPSHTCCDYISHF